MAIKVSQKTIDEIKKMGMTKALASAKTNRSAEFQEGLRRMYGARRLNAAIGSNSAPKSGRPSGTSAGVKGKVIPLAGSKAKATKTKMTASKVDSTTAAKNRAAMQKRAAASKSMSTKAGQRAAESKTTRGVLTEKNGKRISYADMTPKQRQVYKMRLKEQGNRSSKVAGRVASVAAAGMGPLGLGLGAAGQASRADRKKMQKSANRYYTIDRKTGKRK